MSRKRAVVVLGILAACLALAGSAYAQEPQKRQYEKKPVASIRVPLAWSDKLSQIVEEGRAAEARGNLQAAQHAYLEARDAARKIAEQQATAEQKEQAQQAEADAALHYAAVIGTDTSQPAYLDAAKEAYAEAIRLGTPSQQSLAKNNLGVLFLQQKQYPQAVEVFRTIDYARFDSSSQAYLYMYNCGRALELNNEPEAALSWYRKLITVLPGYKPVVEGSFRILRQSGPKAIPAMSDLAGQLITERETDFVGAPLHQALEDWAGEPEAQRLLAVLLRYYVARQVEPTAWKEQEWPRLSALAAHSSTLGPAVEQLRRAYLDDFEPPFRISTGRLLFPAWAHTDWQSKPFSELLTRAGDYYDQRDQPRMALARFMAAWALDTGNGMAATKAVVVLSDHRKEIDPQGQSLRQFSDLLYGQKGTAYFEGNWQDAMRLHTVLGTLYERQNQWGSEGQVDSAIFQWKHAIDAERRLLQSKPELGEDAQLREHLANAYEQAGRHADSRDQYLSAAEFRMKQHDIQLACTALRHAAALSDAPMGSESQQQSFAAMMMQCKTLPKKK